MARIRITCPPACPSCHRFTNGKNSAKCVVPLAAGLLSITTLLTVGPTAAQTTVASNTTQSRAAHIVWVLSEGLGVASEGGFVLPGSPAVVQYEITCTNGALSSVVRSSASVGYGRQVWSIRVKGDTTAADSAESIRSALAPICST
jgi:hypothetical protein